MGGKRGVNRMLYLLDGLDGVVLDGTTVVDQKVCLTLDATRDVSLELPPSGANSATPTEFLVLQGKPIDEPVVQHGPFVMNTRQEIRQTFADYQKTQFGGWPYDDNDPVNEQSKG